MSERKRTFKKAGLRSDRPSTRSGRMRYSQSASGIGMKRARARQRQGGPRFRPRLDDPVWVPSQEIDAMLADYAADEAAVQQAEVDDLMAAFAADEEATERQAQIDDSLAAFAQDERDVIAERIARSKEAAQIKLAKKRAQSSDYGSAHNIAKRKAEAKFRMAQKALYAAFKGLTDTFSYSKRGW